MIYKRIPVAVLCLTVHFVSYSQSKPTITALNRFSINHQDTIYTFFAKKQVKAIPLVQGKTYYWYDGTVIHTTQEGYDGRLLDGEYKVTYPGNGLKEKGQFIKGLKEGKWENWNLDGTLKEVQFWHKGEQQVIAKKKKKENHKKSEESDNKTEASNAL